MPTPASATDPAVGASPSATRAARSPAAASSAAHAATANSPALKTDPIRPDALHPALWRGSQLVRHAGHCVDTGHPALSAELPGGGWPQGSLTELLTAGPGAGELRLLQAALAKLPAQQPIVLLQPPHIPHIAAWRAWQPAPERLLWLRPTQANDALWAADQVLRSGCCAALLFWARTIRPESLRRLHVAAQGSDTLFFMLRPLSAASQSSPAPLRLTLKSAVGGVEVGIAKRRGPARDQPLHIALDISALPPLYPDVSDAPMDLRTPVAAEPRRAAHVLAH